MVFAGNVFASDIIREDFESAPPGIWATGFGTYATSQDYSASSHGLVPDGGEFYAHMIGIEGMLTLHTFNLVDKLTPSEIQAAASGSAKWNFEAWLASWSADGDYTEFSVEWFDDSDGTGNSLGVQILADGSLADNVTRVITAGAIEEDATNWNEDNWSFYKNTDTVPQGAVSAIVRYSGKTTGDSNSNDAYADNVVFTIDTGQSVLQIKSITLEEDAMVTVVFTSQLNQTYALDGSGDMTNWIEIDDSYVGEDGSTSITFVDPNQPDDVKKWFYRIREVTGN